MNIKGLIYCRVSSAKQVKEGNGLSSQEKRCRDYAENTLGISIEKVFNDEGVSGGVFERKSIQDLFKYIDSNKFQSYIVIFEDLNRLSRDIQVHSLLKAEFKKRNIELACPNFQFEESPEGDFKENISVVVAQYEKDKNKQRVNSRMRARLEQGYWCFRVPIGYTYMESPQGGKIVIKDGKTAKIIKKGFEDFAEGFLKTSADLIKFFHKKGLNVAQKNDQGLYKSVSTINNLLRNRLYTGYLELPKWDISLRKANHEAIISVKTYEKIQERLQGISKKVRLIESNIDRKDISEDFPLRGFLYCEESGNFLSAGWSQGKCTKVPYYTYPRNSPMYGKSINRNKFHKEFEDYLKELTPTEDKIDYFEQVFLNVLKERNENGEKYTKQIKKEIKEIDTQINNYIDRIGSTSNLSLIKNYEEKVEGLDKIRKDKTQNIEKNFLQTRNVGTLLKTKLKTVSNLHYIWNNSDLKKKQELVKMVFPAGISINKKRGVGTPTLSLVYQAFELSKTSKIQLVELMGFEPMSREAKEITLLS